MTEGIGITIGGIANILIFLYIKIFRENWNDESNNT